MKPALRRAAPRHVTVHEWVQFLKDKLFDFDEHVVVIVLIKLIPKSSILSLVKLNLCSSRHKNTLHLSLLVLSAKKTKIN